AGDSYVWWAGAVSPGGAVAWSPAQSFSVAGLGLPGLGQPSGTYTIDNPTFTWSPVAGAGPYGLWVNYQTTGQLQVLRAPDLTSTFYAPSSDQALTPGDTYVWWTGAVSPAGRTTWSAPQTVTIASLAAPTLSNPAGATTTANPTFSWSAV